MKGNGTAGDWCFFRCDEVIDGHIVWFEPDNDACRFRAFADLNAGAADYLATLNKRFQSAWPAVLAGDPAAFAHLLKLQNYYTADEGQYTHTLVSLAVEDYFDNGRRRTHVDTLTHELARDTAVTAIELDVIVDVDGRRATLRQLVAERRQRSQHRPI